MRTPSESPSRGVSSNPQSAAPRDEKFVAEIRALGGTIGQKTHYEALGVERDAAPSVIQGAFFRLAKRWHPDRLGSEFADVKDLAVRVFARMTEAHQILSNDGERRAYDLALGDEDGGAEQEEVQRVLRAVTAFQKADVLAKRGNLAEAEKQAQIAVEDDPEQPEYRALRGHPVAEPGAAEDEQLCRRRQDGQRGPKAAGGQHEDSTVPRACPQSSGRLRWSVSRISKYRSVRREQRRGRSRSSLVRDATRKEVDGSQEIPLSPRSERCAREAERPGHETRSQGRVESGHRPDFWKALQAMTGRSLR
jgi:curved DNA-binding protein CbpA